MYDGDRDAPLRDRRPPVALFSVERSKYGTPKVVYRGIKDWARHQMSLFRGDTRSPAEIKAQGGFRPPYMSRKDWENHPEWAKPDLARHVGGDTNAFVSTSTSADVSESFAGDKQYVYVINAPGGIHTDPTMESKTGKESHGEDEVLFPGGIDFRYVRGWYEVSYDSGIHQWVRGDFVPNPDYIGDRYVSGDPAAVGRHSADAMRPGPDGHPPVIIGSLGDQMGRLEDPTLDSLRPYMESTKGGMSVFAPTGGSVNPSHGNDVFTANRVPEIPGQFVVDMHGTQDGVRVGTTRLDEKQVADMIRAHPGYDGGPVTLFGCGAGNNGFAAKVAQELQASVTAPNGDAWVDHDGNVFASSRKNDITDFSQYGKPPKPTFPPDGSWTTHEPGGKSTVSPDSYPPGHTPGWDKNNPPARPVIAAYHRGDDHSTPPPSRDDHSSTDRADDGDRGGRPGGEPRPDHQADHADQADRTAVADRIDRDADQARLEAGNERNDQLKALDQDTADRVRQLELEAKPHIDEVARSRERGLAEVKQDTDRQLDQVERQRAEQLARAGDDQARRDGINDEFDRRAAGVKQNQAERENAVNREADRRAEPTRKELDRKFADLVAEKDQRRDQIEQNHEDRSAAIDAERNRRHAEQGTQPRRDDQARRDDDSRPADEKPSRAPERKDSRSEGRQSWPTDPANGAPLRKRDLDALGLTERQVDWWRDGKAPLGMDPDQFRRFQSELGDLLRANGIDPNKSQLRLVGSSVRFYSGWNKRMEGDEYGLKHTPESRERLTRWEGPERDGMSERRPFDVQYRLGLAPEKSDYDLSVYSDDVVDLARSKWDGKGDFSHEHGHVDKNVARNAVTGFDEFAARWKEKTGRKLGFRLYGLENEPQQRRSKHAKPTDGNWLLDMSERAQPQRPETPVDPKSGYQIKQRDKDFLGYSDEQMKWWQDGDAPLGMTPRQYHDFRASLADAMRAEGVDARDVDIRLKGSGVNGFSNPRKTLENAEHTGESRALTDQWLGDDPDRPTGRPFDSMYRLGLDEEKSDFDVQIRSDDLVRVARQRQAMAPVMREVEGADGRKEWQPVPVVREKYGFVHKDVLHEQFPELDKWAKHWERELGREVAPALFGLDHGPRQESQLDAQKAQRGWPMLGPDAPPLGDRPDPVDPGTVGVAKPDDTVDSTVEPTERPPAKPPADSPVFTDAPESPEPPGRTEQAPPVRGEDGSWSWKDEFSLTPEQNQAVDDFLPTFEKVGHGEDGKGGIRGVMQDIEQSVPYTRLEGLQYDLKGADRLKEKVADRLEGATTTPEEVLRGIPDAIRYTFSLSTGDYTRGVVRITDDLRQRGFEEVRRTNFWNVGMDENPYQGINSRWRDPESGLMFEVQFHTPESWHVKSETHDAYEYEHTGKIEDRPMWNRYQREYFETIPVPPGVQSIVTVEEPKPSV
ncbi:scabin-related ADP-ribosyltransferase [Kibdelosporangium phytohabitans]|uniref:Pierisin-like domain-containing protein n=1 Tax=Kibdelosporangium phytohabitans TaxID=860235 RepID=A0A0N9I419_9PSEU|nr:enterotoxin A family protein [Kibdelosporangium phytohabitans]ALG09273.1 hypothetical protein AOZ06_22285 [Kibdelosporangium phytohabitans]MBE1469479.1 hypothetical protein [Kibdelosporangium phytohabitans]